MRLSSSLVGFTLASVALICVAPSCSSGGDAGGGDPGGDASSDTSVEAGAGCDGCTPAPPSDVGKACTTDADCESVCAGGKCTAPSHADGKVSPSLGETDVDCGGMVPDGNGAPAVACATGRTCAAGTDCASKFCGVDKKCEPRKAGRKDGDETDVDCGGTADPDTKLVPARCGDELGCLADGDCKSTLCNTTLKVCVVGRSCKGIVGGATAGINTCGKRETSDPTKVHESCCRSLPLPATPSVRLDKYEVTSGRMRQFIESVGPNLRKWANDEIAAATPTGMRLANDIPVTLRDLLPASATPNEPLNLLVQVGALAMDTRLPGVEGSQGCFNNATDAFGANTYWWDQATLVAHFVTHAPRKFTKEQYDEKSMNCGAYWMYAAFCAWDGGRLPTPAEVQQAWGTTTYPWGTATYTLPTNPGPGLNTHELTANYFNNNWSSTGRNFYHFPDGPDAADEAGEIAAPGRFVMDATMVKSNGESWMDLGANLMEVTHYNTEYVPKDFCDFAITKAAGDVPTAACQAAGHPNDPLFYGVLRKTNMPVSRWTGGSWEGHQQFTFDPTKEPWFVKVTDAKAYNLAVQTQYGKTGVRCAR